jgi:hypothetical protein
MDTKKRRDVTRVLLVFDLLSGTIYSPNLLSQISLIVLFYQTLSLATLDTLNSTRRTKTFSNLYQRSYTDLNDTVGSISFFVENSNSEYARL